MFLHFMWSFKTILIVHVYKTSEHASAGFLTFGAGLCLKMLQFTTKLAKHDNDGETVGSLPCHCFVAILQPIRSDCSEF